MRRTFIQALKNGKFDACEEYSKLYELFYYVDCDGKSISDYINSNMISFPFRGTCITLEEFDEVYGFNFEEEPSEFDEEYLVSFCEYFYNFLMYLDEGCFLRSKTRSFFVEQIFKVIEKIGYEELQEEGFTLFVPKNSAAKEVAQSELIPDDFSYKVVEFNHHSVDLEGKKDILLKLSNILEPKRAVLRSVNKNLESDIFFILNNYNIRHNNIAEESSKYRSDVANMGEDELIEVYNNLYQMMLAAILMLDYEENRSFVEKLKYR